MDVAHLTAFGQAWLENLSVDLSRYITFAVGVWILFRVLLARPLAAQKDS